MILSSHMEKVAGLIKGKIALELLRGIVLKTPVDSGRLRANWVVGAGTPAAGEPYQGKVLSPGAAANESLTREVPKITADLEPVYIQNNVVYAPVIEYGDEKHEPRAMVRTTIEEVKEMFR